MAIDAESMKRVLGSMRNFARGERLKSLKKRLDPAAPGLAAGQQDDPELQGIALGAEGSPAEEANESPAEEGLEDKGALKITVEPGAKEAGGDDEEALIKHLLSKM